MTQTIPHAAAHPSADPQFFTPDAAGANGIPIAFRRRLATGEGRGRPGIVWLSGFKSDMLSTKATRLSGWSEAKGRALLRFDYSGHGESGGRFEDGSIGRWLAESLALIRAETEGPQILVGSSMGAWIALLAARELAAAGQEARLAGLVLIAPAVDFTEALMWPQMPEDVRETIMTKGVWLRPSDYGAPYPITRGLIEDGRRHLLLGGTIRTHCPVHVLQGMRDPDVPWQHAMTLIEHIAGDPAILTLVKDGDHRLSREEDLARLIGAVEAVA